MRTSACRLNPSRSTATAGLPGAASSWWSLDCLSASDAFGSVATWPRPTAIAAHASRAVCGGCSLERSSSGSVANVRSGEGHQQGALPLARAAELLGASPKRTHPEATDSPFERPQPRNVVGHPVVAVVPDEHRAQV